MYSCIGVVDFYLWSETKGLEKGSKGPIGIELKKQVKLETQYLRSFQTFIEVQNLYWKFKTFIEV